MTAMKQVTRSDSRRRSKRPLAHTHRVALAQGCQANAHRLRPQVVVLRGGVLRHQPLGCEAGQVAVHLGGVFARFGRNGGEAGRAPQPRQRFQDGHAGFGRLHALAALAAV